MITEQTRRRRRGRAIRKARHAQQHCRPAQHRRPATSPVWRFLGWCAGGFVDAVTRAIDALADALVAIGTTARVAATRITPLPFTPRDGAGARRQLLEHGRAPRKGGR